jgi:hypothetical protein
MSATTKYSSEPRVATVRYCATPNEN